MPGGAGTAEAGFVDATAHTPRSGAAATATATNSPAGWGGASRSSGGGTRGTGSGPAEPHPRAPCAPPRRLRPTPQGGAATGGVQ